MHFAKPLLRGVLVRRYKRFLADVDLEDGRRITAHTANTGRMQGLCEPGSQVFVSQHDNPKRKLPFTWELIRIGRRLVGVDPTRSNALVAEALEAGGVPELQGYQQVTREVRWGASRLDFCLRGGDTECFIEVKTATLQHGDSVLFPDGVSVRGQRHLQELVACCQAGYRAVIFFVVQRADIATVGLADHIDPDYGRLFREALAEGVEAIAYGCRVNQRGIRLAHALRVDLNDNAPLGKL